MIIAIEGPNFAGKTTLVKELSKLFAKDDISCMTIPEYVDLIGGNENKQPDRPFTSKEDLKKEGEYYINLEKKIQKILKNKKYRIFIRDRSFFTCLTYAKLSKNPVSEKMFKQYINSENCIHPDLIIFLDIDLNSREYKRRLNLRKKKNSRLRGLNYKIKEFSYIYKHKEYGDYFKKNLAMRYLNIVFVNSLKTDAMHIYNLIKSNMITNRGVIWPGYVCDLKCIFCYNDNMKRKWKSIKELKKEIHRARFVYGNSSIDFMGGEPTLHPKIIELIRYCSKIGIKPTLITNGLKLSDIIFLKKLKKVGISEFLVSIHGIGKTEDKIFNTNKKGYFKLQMKAIDNINKLKIPFRINTTLIKYNKKDLIKIAKLAVKKKAKAINFIMFNPHFAWSKRKNIKFQDKYSNITPYLKKVINYLEKHNLKVNVRYLPFCQLKGYEKSVYNCAQLPYDEYEWDYNSWHSYKEKNPDKQWYFKKGIEQAKKNGNIKGKLCKKCALRKICDGFHSQYILRYGFNEAKPYKGKLIINPNYFIENG